MLKNIQPPKCNLLTIPKMLCWKRQWVANQPKMGNQPIWNRPKRHKLVYKMADFVLWKLCDDLVTCLCSFFLHGFYLFIRPTANRRRRVNNSHSPLALTAFSKFFFLMTHTPARRHQTPMKRLWTCKVMLHHRLCVSCWVDFSCSLCGFLPHCSHCVFNRR